MLRRSLQHQCWEKAKLEGTDNYSELTVQAKERITLENNKLILL